MDGTLITYVEVPAWLPYVLYGGGAFVLFVGIGLVLHFGALAYERWFST